MLRVLMKWVEVGLAVVEHWEVGERECVMWLQEDAWPRIELEWDRGLLQVAATELLVGAVTVYA